MMSAVCMASHFNEIIQISIADRCVGRFLSAAGRLCPNFKTPKWCKQKLHQMNNNIQHPFNGLLNDVDVAAVELCFSHA